MAYGGEMGFGGIIGDDLGLYLILLLDFNVVLDWSCDFASDIVLVVSVAYGGEMGFGRVLDGDFGLYSILLAHSGI